MALTDSSVSSASEEEEGEEEDNTVFGRAKRQRQNAPAWKKELAKELLRSKLKVFPRRRIFSPHVDAIWAVDLLDIHKYQNVNKNYNFILVVIDIFSKYAWARPLKFKTGILTSRALEDVIITSKRSPSKIWVDRGRQFYNRYVTDVCQRYNIQLYSTYNEPKSAIAERFIRTLRKKIEHDFILTHSTVWYDILPQLIHEYNTTYHRSISMTPEDATKPENYQKAFDSLYNRPNRKSAKQLQKERTAVFNVGDKVRISLHKRLFEKGSTANWSEEIFEVSDVLVTKRPVVYKLKDLADEELEGTFYKEQLQKTDQNIYRVDQILQRRRKPDDGSQEVLVKWFGWPEKFNSWEPAENILKGGT